MAHIGEQGSLPGRHVGLLAHVAVEVAIGALRKAEGPVDVECARQNRLQLILINELNFRGPMDWSKLFTPIAGVIALLCATGVAVTASGSSNVPDKGGTRGAASSAGDSPSGLHLAARALRVHNDERRRLNLPPLKWNVHLEKEAGQWARVLSLKGNLVHADRKTLNGTGENLWMGTAGHWPVETMVGMFIDEKKHYRHANFPDISRTGNWADVGHYTQIVWRDTKEVGCAVVTARGNDVLVCRYWPAGNIWGRKAY